jgi:hypothetical protein
MRGDPQKSRDFFLEINLVNEKKNLEIRKSRDSRS